MAYKFDPVINTYVDPKSVEISKTLNERFAQNFAVNDALNTAIRDMQFAPFENDSALAKQAREETDAKLQQIAERGDYENMTFPLHTLAKETGNKLKPLADNYSRYANTLTDLNKRMQEGKVNAEQYDLYKSYMTRGYKGLEMDEMGRVKQGTEFSAPMLYNDPKVMDRITERLKIIHSKKTGSETSGYQRDAEGNLLAITQGGTLEKVDQADVQAAVDAVMQESDVKMYFDQMGTMKTTKYSDAMGGPQALIATQTTNLQDQIGKLNDAMNSGQYSGAQKKQMTESVKSLQNQLTTIQGLKTPEEQLAYAKKSFVEEYQRPIYEYANLKAGVYEQTSKYTVKNITAEEKEKKQIEWDINNPTAYDVGEINATQWGGKNIDEKVQNITSTQNKIAELEQTINSGIKDGVKIGDEELGSMRREVETLKNDRKTLEAQIKQAARNSISYEDFRNQDPTVVDALSKMYKTKDIGDLYMIFKNTFDSKQDQDYMAFTNYFDHTYGQNKWNEHKAKYYREPADAPQAGNAAPYNLFTRNFQEKLDEGLTEVKIAPVFTINKVVGLTADDTRGFTNTFNKIFLNQPLRAGAVYKNADGEQIDGLEGYTVVGYGMPQYGSKLMKLQVVKGDNKTPEVLYMDMDQITSPELQRVYNSNSFKLASRVTDAGNLSKFDINLNSVDPNTNQYVGQLTLRFNDVRGNGKPLVTVIGADGNPITDLSKYGINQKLTGAIDPNSDLFKSFISLPYFQVN